MHCHYIWFVFPLFVNAPLLGGAPTISLYSLYNVLFYSICNSIFFVVLILNELVTKSKPHRSKQTQRTIVARLSVLCAAAELLCLFVVGFLFHSVFFCLCFEVPLWCGALCSIVIYGLTLGITVYSVHTV